MRILHMVMTPSLGGLEQAFIDISTMLCRNGHEVVCVVRRDAPYASQIEAPAHTVLMKPPVGFYDLRAVWRLRRMLKTYRIDAIIAHTPRSIQLADWARKGTAIPLCGMLHSYNLNKLGRIKGAERLVALTPDMRAMLLDRGLTAERVTVITNAITLPQDVAPRPCQSPLRVGFLGRITVEKGLKDLLDACQSLPLPNVVHIGGSGVLENELKALAKLRGMAVKWHGWVENKDAFFHGIDVLCLPSHQESFGLVMLEAMARNIPVIATRTAGPESLITHNTDGLLVPVGAPQAFAEALARIVQEPGLHAALAKAGRQRAEQFDINKICQHWEQLTTELISLKNQGRKRSLTLRRRMPAAASYAAAQRASAPSAPGSADAIVIPPDR